MNVQVKWVNLPASVKVHPLIRKEVNKIERQFPEAKEIGVRFKKDGRRFQAQVNVMALGRDWWVSGEGSNVFEGLSQAFQNAQRKIREFKRYSRDKINKRFSRPENILF
jgi:ribosome-associated translation inhibitor RaiA